MKYARYLIVFSIVFLSSCAQFPVSGPGEGGDVLSPKQALSQSAKLVAKRHWGEAIALLNKALGQHPDSEEIKKQLQVVERAWDKARRRLEDRILLFEAVALKQKLPLLRQLSENEPANYLLRSRVAYWEQVASSKSEALLECGTFYADTDLSFARRCVVLARQLKPGKQADELLKTLKKRERRRTQAKQKRKKSLEVAARRNKVARMLAAVDVDVERGEYARAIALLDKALALESDNQDAIQRRREVLELLNAQVDALIAEGDLLYRREMVEAAVVAWEKALALDPKRQALTAKIARAHKILQKLRRYQQAKERPSASN